MQRRRASRIDDVAAPRTTLGTGGSNFTMTGFARRSLRVLIAMTFAWGPAAAVFAAEEVADVIAVESVILSVKQALIVAQSELDAEELPKIKSAVLTLETLYSPRSDGRNELVIAKAGAPFDRSRIQKLVIDVKPPRARSRPISARELEETLAQLVVAGARATGLVDSDPNPLDLNASTAQFRFVVLKAGAGGLGFSISPVSRDLEVPMDRASVQILTIGYQAR